MTIPTLSVIIPTLNEAEHLPFLLGELVSQRDVVLEIFIADGGSTDATRSIAESFKTTFVSAERGRGKQMNSASSKASSDYLLFLHADSRIADEYLLSHALRALREEIGRVGRDAVAGHFRLQFIRSNDSNARAYRYAEEKSAFNRANTTNGDQGLLLTREYFDRLGGFDERLPFLEDQQIAEKIRSHGNIITLPGCLKTSARRFETEGFHRRYTLMSMMMGLYSIGEESFFIRAPNLYRVQQDTGKLLLDPFFQVIRQLMREQWGVWGTIRAFYLLGRYIRGNSWQMFYFFDIWVRHILGPDRYPCLKFHDRIFAPLTGFRVFNVITGFICFIWFIGVLSPYYRFVDRRSYGKH